MSLPNHRYHVVYGPADAPAGGGGGTAPEPAPVPAGSPSGPASPAADAPAAPSWLYELGADRPEDVPEKFWNADKKGVDVAGTLKAYRELEGKFGQKTDKLKEDLKAELRQGVPAKAEDYAVKVSDGVLPEGFKMALPAESDPLLKGMRELFHETGAKPEQWQKALDLFVGWQAQNLPNVTAEKQRLGEGADERVAAVDMWLAKHFEADQPAYAALTRWATADLVRGLESLMKANGAGGVGQGLPGSGAGGGGMTASDAFAAMSQPEYRDPVKGIELRQKVAAFTQAGGKVPGFGGFNR